MGKKKKFSHRMQVDAVAKDPSRNVTCEFSCAMCNKECIDVTVAKDAEKCQKLFHFTCVGITGNENFLKESNDIDYICSQCNTQLNAKLMTISTLHSSPHPEISSSTITWRGRARGRGHQKSISEPSSSSSPCTTEINYPSNGASQRVTRSGRTVRTPATLQTLHVMK